MKRMNRFLALVLCLLMVFSLAACTNTATEPTAEGETETPVNVSDRTYHIATGALGAYNYTLYAGISDLIEKAYPGKYEIALDCASGSTEMGRLCAMGDCDFGTCTMDDLFNCFNGTNEFENVPSGQIRFLYNTGGSGPTSHIVVPKNSDIESVYDLAGKTVGVPSGYYQKYFGILMEEAGITDYTIDTLAINDIVNGIKDETIDAAYYSAPHPLNNFVDLASTTGCKFINIGDELVDKILADYPFMHKVVMPANTYEGQTEEIISYTANTCWICRYDVPDEVVYDWLSVIMSPDTDLSAIHPNAKNICLKDALNDYIIPLHPGALKFYQDQGKITEDKYADLKPTN